MGGTGAEGPAYPKGPGHGAGGWGQWGHPLQEPHAPTQQTQPLRPGQGASGGLCGWCQVSGVPPSLCSAPSVDEEGIQKRPCRGTPAEWEAGPASLCVPLACMWLQGPRGAHVGGVPEEQAERRSLEAEPGWGRDAQPGGVRAVLLGAGQGPVETLGPRACGRNDLVLGEFHSVPG